MKIESYTGGDYQTNAFVVDAPEGKILFDAPEGVADWLDRRGLKVGLLLLTHAHFDHTLGAAEVLRRQGCEVGYHADGRRMLAEPDFFVRAGFGPRLEPVSGGRLLEEGAGQVFLGSLWDVLHVPGHCPGSLCFLQRESGVLIGGDVLFAGGVGRWDLPGADGELLFRGIAEKVMVLDDSVRVYPGHGPSTTIGAERATNPFLAGG